MENQIKQITLLVEDLELSTFKNVLVTGKNKLGFKKSIMYIINLNDGKINASLRVESYSIEDGSSKSVFPIFNKNLNFAVEKYNEL